MIFTVTLNTAVDRIIEIEGVLTRKANNKTRSIKYDIGGKAIHVSVALSYMNIPNIATGIIGGKKGRFMVEMAKKKGVDCHFFEQEESETRESIVLLDQSGQGSYMITQGGFTLSEQSISKIREFLINNVQKDDIVVFAGTPPKDFNIQDYHDLLMVVKNKEAKLVADTTKEYLQAALTCRPILIKPNEFEFQEFLQQELNTIDDYKNALRSMDELAEIIVVSLGKKGSIAKRGNEIVIVTPPTISEVNETGAGDFFVAGLVAKLHEEATLEEILRFGTAVGASKAMQKEVAHFDYQEALSLMSECTIERV